MAKCPNSSPNAFKVRPLLPVLHVQSIQLSIHRLPLHNSHLSLTHHPVWAERVCSRSNALACCFRNVPLVWPCGMEVGQDRPRHCACFAFMRSPGGEERNHHCPSWTGKNRQKQAKTASSQHTLHHSLTLGKSPCSLLNSISSICPTNSEIY
jgi:hypothetical protein